MAILTLGKIWVNLVSTGEAVSAYSSDRGLNISSRGEVRTYAGGRQRAITGKGIRREFNFKLRDVPDADVATLDSWQTRLVCVRDYRGQRFFGTYYGLAVTERRSLNLNDVGMSLIEVTYDEGA